MLLVLVIVLLLGPMVGLMSLVAMLTVVLRPLPSTQPSPAHPTPLSTRPPTPFFRARARRYFHHANDYYNQRLPFDATGVVPVCDPTYTDLWLNDGPAEGLNGTGAYEEDVFRNHTLATIGAHAREAEEAARRGEAVTPLFLFHAFHIVHTPLQAS